MSLVRIVLLVTLLPSVRAKVIAKQMTSRIVHTQYGRIRGIEKSMPGTDLPDVEAYLGLEYASLLDGELRFMPPTSPMDHWDDVRMQMKFKPVCPQRLPDVVAMDRVMPRGRVDHFRRLTKYLKDQAEECLNLNVYVPTARNESDLLPVVVLIHGETYEIGSGNAYDGSVMAAYGQVVVVTINYRLGVLGFLSTGDSNAPGNYALLDQVAALHWVRENIKAFGGDPSEVTLLGQGYGAAMVNLLMVSPVTRGRNLFKKAIIQSGSALSSWAISHDPLRYTLQLAEAVNCSHFWGQSAQLVQCFKNLPYEDLVRLDIDAPKYYSSWAPVIDRHSVLPDDVRSLMKSPDSLFGNVNLLLGVMKNEGFLYFSEEEVTHGVTPLRLHQILRTYVRNLYRWHRQKIYEILLHHYTDWESPDDPDMIRDNLMEFLGDGQYIAPLVDLSRLHADTPANTYAYGFTYPSRTDTYPRWAGGVHGDDMPYVFGAPLSAGVDPFNKDYTQAEKMLSEAVLTYWCNFIRSGNPNVPISQSTVHVGKIENRFAGLEWPKLDNEKQEFMHIGMRPLIRHHMRGSKMALWLDLLPKIHHSDNLDTTHHLLENYDNSSTFEAFGTRKLDAGTLHPIPPLQPETPYVPEEPSTTTTTPPTTTTMPTTTPQPTTTTRRNQPPPSRSRRPPKGSRHGSRTTTPLPTTPEPTPAASGFAMDGMMSLSVTIAVGCSLLFLNILIFAGVYYQKDRMRKELKLRQREIEKEKEIYPGECEHLKSNASPETDTNSSSMMTPTIGMTHVQHMHSPGAVTTLPKHAAIPVCPPQAPYHTMPRGGAGRARLNHHQCEHHDGIIKHTADNDHLGNHHHANPSTVV